MNDKYCYSRDEEEFHGDFDSREEAEAELDGHSGWVGKVKNPYAFFKPEVLGDQIVELMDSWLIDDISGDETILSTTAEQSKELGELVLNWMRANIEPNRFGVCEVQYVAAAEKESE